MVGAVSESLGKNSPGDLSKLSCGVFKGKDGLILGCKECKRRCPLSPGLSNKQYPEIFGLKVYRDLKLQGGEALLLH
jgi:hypothetical protein